MKYNKLIIRESRFFKGLLSLSVILLVSCSKQPASQIGILNEPVPLHEMPPQYPVSYGIPAADSITKVLTRVLDYLNGVTPMAIVDKESGEVITGFSSPNTNAILQRGDFPIVCYEWGVTYGAMIWAGKVTEQGRFTD